MNIEPVEIMEIPENVETNNNTFTKITNEEIYAFHAIEMWYNVVYRCRILTLSNHDDDYRAYISNILTQPDTNILRQQVRKVIADFYDYFYIQKHIAHMNYRKYDKLTDDYAQFKTIVLNLFSGIEKGICPKEGIELINILIEVSLYAFEKISPFRKEWGLYVFEDEKQDEYLVKYYSDYDERKIE